MKFIKSFDRRGSYFGGIAIMLLAVILPAFASAAQVTERSIALSSASTSAQNVTYTVNFTAVTAAGAFVVDFCNDSPLVGTTCTPPVGFDATAAATTTSGFTVTGSTSKFVVVGAITASQQVSVAVTGINNTSASGPMYARIVSYDSGANANLYTSTALGSGVKDQGSVAMYINPTAVVSGVVLESMTFCVSGSVIAKDCSGTLTAPVLTLGEPVSAGLVALNPNFISTGVINTQISTNAASGAIVSLKSSAANCGGLLRAGAPTACDILPAPAGAGPTGSITAGQARFGVMTSTTTDSAGTTASGVFEPVAASGYNNSTYVLNYIAGNATGVTSTFGDPFLDTNGAPVNNKNMALTFGASISSSTPAGLYSTDLSLIATGKF